MSNAPTVEQAQKIKEDLLSNGFTIIETGGGCQCYQRNFETEQHELYVWITEEDDPSVDIQSQLCSIGVYDDRTGDCLFDSPITAQWSDARVVANLLMGAHSID